MDNNELRKLAGLVAPIVLTENTSSEGCIKDLKTAINGLCEIHHMAETAPVIRYKVEEILKKLRATNILHNSYD